MPKNKISDHKDVGPCNGLTVMQVIPELDIGGAELTTFEMTQSLVSAGGRAIIVSQGGRLAEPIAQAGGENIILPVASKNPLTMIQNAYALAGLVREYNIDIIHARSRAPAWSAFWAARKTGAAFLTTYHSKVHMGPRLKVLYNSVMTRGDVVIANSEFTAEQIKKAHGVASERIRVIPRGCDVDALDPQNYNAEKRAVLRRQFGFGDDDFVILCPARLTRWKGQHVLLEAVSLCFQDSVPQKKLKKASVQILFAGDAQGRDAYVDELNARAQKYNLNVSFAGLVEDMPAIYAASDLIVIPSVRAEPFGRTAIEAQAAGRPVIASNAGGFKETVCPVGGDEAATGWLVTPDNAADLALALEAAMSLTPRKRDAMGRAARKYILSKYTRARMCASTLQVYRDLWL